jgi:hypothetical protein
MTRLRKPRLEAEVRRFLAPDRQHHLAMLWATVVWIVWLCRW